MAEWWKCILVLVMCSAAIGIVTVVSCAAAWVMQRIADKCMDRWWKK